MARRHASADGQARFALDREIATERFTAAQRQSEQETALAAGRARAEIAQELHDVLGRVSLCVKPEGDRA